MDDFSWADNLPPTLAIEDAAKLLGNSRSTAYAEAARYRLIDGRSGLPNFRMGSHVAARARSHLVAAFKKVSTAAHQT